jgi:hypothetical protein
MEIKSISGKQLGYDYGMTDLVVLLKFSYMQKYDLTTLKIVNVGS